MISLEKLLTTLAKVYNIVQVVHLFKDDQLQFGLLRVSFKYLSTLSIYDINSINLEVWTSSCRCLMIHCMESKIMLI